VLLGYMTFRGFGTGADPQESVRLHEIAAQRYGMFKLYVLLSTGRGLAKDEARALQWCERAAAQDHVRALEFYLRASEAGHGPASAAAHVMLWSGEGTKTDRARARQRFGLR
jgi:uncharacterized protein